MSLFSSNSKISLINAAEPNFINGQSISKEIKLSINKSFKIFSELPLPPPYPDSYWNEINQWTLINYPKDILELIAEDSVAPDGVGGNLLQEWKFKPLKSGNSELIFKRYNYTFTVRLKIVSSIEHLLGSIFLT